MKDNLEMLREAADREWEAVCKTLAKHRRDPDPWRFVKMPLPAQQAYRVELEMRFIPERRER